MVDEFFPGRINCIPLQTINVVLHVACLRSLAKTYTGRYRNPQHLYLVNLSAAIVVRNMVYMALVIVDWKTGLVKWTHGWTELDLTELMLYIIFSAAVFTLYVCAVILVTGDRLLVSLLNLRYRALYTVGYAKKTIAVLWITVCVLTGSVCVSFLRSSSQLLAMKPFVETLDRYEAGLCAVQLIFTITAYILIFIQYSTSRRRVTSYNRQSSRPSFFFLFRNSRFAIAIVIVGSFLLFIVLPHIIHCVFLFSSEKQPPFIEMFLYVLRYVADILDVLVYGFLYPPIRKLFRDTVRVSIQKLPSRKRSNRVRVMGGIRTLHTTGETSAM